jgi:8-oxo-dGTP pyrophosphatase MutT (NUDIX family)
MSSTLLKKLLLHYNTTNEKELIYQNKMMQLLDNEPELCFSRDLLSGHFTASAFIVNSERDSTLLLKHTKLNRWLQPGGHCDGDSDIENVAIKEVFEETGLIIKKAENPKIFDVDIHTIPERKGVPEHLHYDVRFLFVVNESELIEISDESTDIRWVPLNKIDDYNLDESIIRMTQKIVK